MKQLIKIFKPSLVAFIFFYLLLTFYNVDFNVLQWDKDSKGVVCFATGFTLFMTILHLDIKNKL